MTNLIKAADALAEQMRLIEEEAKRTIEWDEEDPIRMLDWFDTEWINSLTAYRQARESAEDADVHRRLKEMLFELIGSVQNPVEDPVREDVCYGGVLVEDGKKAYLKLVFEEPTNAARESADGVKVARKAMGLMLEGIRKGGLDTEMGHHLIDDIFYPAIDSYIKAALED
ncbi:hypothetical protein VWY34_15520 [Phaeobacter sp. JH20_02]|uniref:hypothetical protein n=1 Tax=unclassified Phaeobacter TaxID=2621772 RepID=UPI003A863181